MLNKISLELIIVGSIVMCLTGGCYANSIMDVEESNILLVGDDGKNNSLETEGESFASQDKIAEETPDFLTGYFDLGVYKKPIRIANSVDNYSNIKCSNENRLELPEAVILSVVFDKWGDGIKLWKQDDEKLKIFIQLLQGVLITSQENIRGMDMDYEQDAEVSFVILKGNGNFALLTLRSFKDDYIEILVEQEDCPKKGIYATYSKDIRNKLREICEVEIIAKEMLLNADNIKYLSKNKEWVELSEEKLRDFNRLISKSSDVKNYSTGCPFDLKILVEVGENEYSVKASTDSCGILIVGDKTYQLQKDDRDEMRNIFTQISWDGVD